MGLLSYPYTKDFLKKLDAGEFVVTSIGPTSKGANAKLQLKDSRGKKLYLIINNPSSEDDDYDFVGSRLCQIEIDSVSRYFNQDLFITSQALFVSDGVFCRLHDSAYRAHPISAAEKRAIVAGHPQSDSADLRGPSPRGYASIMEAKSAMRPETYQSSAVFDKSEPTINLDFIGGHDWFVYTPIDEQKTMELIALGATFATAPKLIVSVAVEEYKPIREFRHVTPISGKKLRHFMEIADAAGGLSLTKKNEKADYYYVTITGFADLRKEHEK